MFGSLGIPELIIIMAIALIIFGPRKLPELGKALGQTIKEFKKGSSSLIAQLEDEVAHQDHQVRHEAAVPPRDPALRRSAGETGGAAATGA